MWTRKLRVLFLVLTTLGAGTAAAGSLVYQVRPGDSEVSFTIVKWGVFREHGRVPDVKGRIVVDDEKPERSSVEIEIGTATVDTGVAGRDRAVRSEALLHSGRYPRMTFTSREVRPREAGLYDVTGDLTIRGVTRRVTVPVRLTGRGRAGSEGDLIGFETTFNVDRTAHGVGDASGTFLAKELQVRLAVAASR
jgi:polyisoprenoid-binding protein YceI